MNKLCYLGGIGIMLLFMVGCSSSDNEPINYQIETTEEGSLQRVIPVYAANENPVEGLQFDGVDNVLYIVDGQLMGDGFSFSTPVRQGLAEMIPYSQVDTWTIRANVAEKQAYWVRHMSTERYTYMKLRISYLTGVNAGIEYLIDTVIEVAPGEEGNVNANVPTADEKYVTDYAMPRMDPMNLYVEHIVNNEDNAVLNYALEWNDEKKHAAWVAFTFDEVTKADQTNRPDDDPWATDPMLPTGMSPTDADHRADGFDRGHLCASNDRLFTVAANEQTFYYSNISPMLNSFNGGFWASFEILVQNWGRSDDYDKVYVAKGGTLDQLLINYTGVKAGNDGVIPKTDENGFTIHGLACPKYYFMAVLTEHEGEYHAIGFWMEHRDDYGYEYDEFAPSDVMKTYALSIDDLEERTGLDFFCNLPDVIENEVESSWSEADWTW